MKTMSTVAKGIILFSLSLLALPVRGAEPIRIGAFQVVPFIIQNEDTSITGAVVEYYNQYIFPKLGKEVKWYISNVARLQIQLKDNQYQMVPILTKTKEREEYLLFADTSYISFDPNVVVLDKSALKKVEQQSDLFGMKIGWTTGGVYPDFLKHAQIKIEEVPQTDWEISNMKRLALSRIDAAYFSNSPASSYFARHAEVPTRIVPLPLPPIQLYAAFPKEQEALRNQYNEVAKTAFAQNKFSDFMSTYLKQVK